MQAGDAREAGRRAGLEVVVLFAENNAVLQIQQLFRHIHAPEGERPVAIVVEALTGEGLERVARNAASAGVSWVLLNWNVPYVPELRQQHPNLTIATVAVDEKEIGRIQARQFRALAPQGGPLLYLQGPPDSTPAHGRLLGLQEALGDGFDVRILNGDWTEDSGEKAMRSWLRLKTSAGFHPAIVGCQNDAMAVGARRALIAQRRGSERIPFTGCDGLPEGGRALVGRDAHGAPAGPGRGGPVRRERRGADAGLLAATVVTPSNTGPALERLSGWLRTGQVPPRDLLLEPQSYPPEGLLRP